MPHRVVVVAAVASVSALLAAVAVWWSGRRQRIPEQPYQNTYSTSERDSSYRSSSDGKRESCDPNANTSSFDARARAVADSGVVRLRRSNENPVNETEERNMTNTEKARHLREIFPAVEFDVCKFIIERFNGDLEDSARYVMHEYEDGHPQGQELPPASDVDLIGIREQCIISTQQEMTIVRHKEKYESASMSIDGCITSTPNKSDTDKVLTSENIDGAWMQQPDRHRPERREEELQLELSYLNAIEQEIERKRASLAEQERALNDLAGRVATLGLSLGADAGKFALPQAETGTEKLNCTYSVMPAVVTASPRLPACAGDSNVILAQEDLLVIPSVTPLVGGEDGLSGLILDYPRNVSSSTTSGVTVTKADEDVSGTLSPSYAASHIVPDEGDGFAYVSHPDTIPGAVSDPQEALSALSESSWSDVCNDIR